MIRRSKVALEPYQLESGPVPEEIYHGIHLPETFHEKEYRLVDLSYILYAAQGVREKRWGIRFRTVPSAGATYPLEVYVVARAVEGLSPGIYHYVAESVTEHYLERVSDLDAVPELEKLMGKVPCSLIISSIYERTTARYGHRGIRYVHLEVGHLLQNVWLMATLLMSDIEPIPIPQELEERLRNIVSGRPHMLIHVGYGSGVRSIAPKDEFTEIPILKEVEVLEFERSSLPLAIAVRERRSVREFSKGEVLKFSSLCRLLVAGSGYGKYGYRTYIPLNFSEYTCELFVVVRSVNGIEPGVYRYNPLRGVLELVRKGAVYAELADACLGQEWVENAQVNFVILARKTSLKRVGTYVAEIEAGQMCQNICLQATALELGSVPIGAFYDFEVLRVLGVPLEVYEPLYVCSVGVRW